MADNPPELVIDLFGDVVTLPSGRRGRPAHVWSKSNADRVTIALAMGFRDEEIADGLHISLPTLRKYYFSQIKARAMQRTRFELWRAETLAALANDGNVGAMKELGKILAARDKHLADQAIRAKAPEERKGKKQARAEAAEEIAQGDLYAPGYGRVQ